MDAPPRSDEMLAARSLVVVFPSRALVVLALREVLMALIGPRLHECVSCGAIAARRGAKICGACLARARRMRHRICNDPDHQGDRFIPAKSACVKTNLCRACDSKRRRERRLKLHPPKPPRPMATLAAETVLSEYQLALRQLAMRLIRGLSVS